MGFLTPAERRAVVVVALLFALGAGRDLWRAAHPRMLPAPALPSAGDPVREGLKDPPAPPAPAAVNPRSPNSGAGIQEPQGPPSTRGATVPNVDLNRASIAELDRLPGVGPVLARRIVEHRERHGPFREVEELLAVRGIGPRLLERLREHVRANPP